MRKRDFLRIIQSHVARIAVGPSAVRGRGNTGVGKAARTHLRLVDLSQFGTENEKAFRAALGNETKKLRHAFPRRSRKWGLARKLLNIFLRDCAYTIYLAREYDLHLAKEFFEIPLDSITARGLERLKGRGNLPPWPGIKHLIPRLSRRYQHAAQQEAHKKGIARLHLDALLWSVSRDDNEV